MRSPDLSPLQLEIVMYIANGKTLGEIAVAVDRSRSHIAKQTDRARRKSGARTLPQLVSIVIASGRLGWLDEGDAGYRVVHDLEATTADGSRAPGNRADLVAVNSLDHGGEVQNRA